jgi:DNA-binding NtrC family response regulator
LLSAYSRQWPPDLLIIDFWLSSSTALKLLKEIKNSFPKMRLLVVSGDENNDIWIKYKMPVVMVLY